MTSYDVPSAPVYTEATNDSREIVAVSPIPENDDDNDHDAEAVEEPCEAAPAAPPPVSFLSSAQGSALQGACTSNITTLILRSCMLHDEDLAFAFGCSTGGASFLPHLHYLDISCNVLQAFPTYLFARNKHNNSTASLNNTHHMNDASLLVSPWIIDASDNPAMRLLPTVVLETLVIGFLSVEGCDALSPAAVVEGLKGLLAGEVRVPRHTDQMSVVESMLGLVSINGALVCELPQAPQHAKKCEMHLQQIKRHFQAPHAPWFVANLFASLKLMLDTRHVDHPRLLEKHKSHVRSVSAAYLADTLATRWALRNEATDKTPLPPPSTPDAPPPASSQAAPVMQSCGSLAFQTPPSSAVAGSNTFQFLDSVAPFYFGTWRGLLCEALQEKPSSSANAAVSRLPVVLAALILLFDHDSVLPSGSSLTLINFLLEDIAEELELAGGDYCQAVDVLCDSVNWWPKFAYHLLLDSIRHDSTLFPSRVPDWVFQCSSTAGGGCALEGGSSNRQGTAKQRGGNGDVFEGRVLHADSLPLGAVIVEIERCKKKRPERAYAFTDQVLCPIIALSRKVEATKRAQELLNTSSAAEVMKKTSAAVESKKTRDLLFSRTLHYEARPMSRVGSLSASVHLQKSGSPPLLGQRLQFSTAQPTSMVDEALWNASLREEAEDVSMVHRDFLPSRGTVVERSQGKLPSGGAYCVKPLGNAHFGTRPPTRGEGSVARSPMAEHHGRPQSVSVMKIQALDMDCTRIDGLPADTPTYQALPRPNSAIGSLFASMAPNSVYGSSRSPHRGHHSPLPGSPPRKVDHRNTSRMGATNIVQYLKKKGQLRLIGQQAVDTIRHALEINVEDVNKSSSALVTVDSSYATPPRRRGRHGGTLSFTQEELMKAEVMMFGANSDTTPALDAEVVLKLIHFLTAAGHRRPGEVYRTFVTLACVTARDAGIRLSEIAHVEVLRPLVEQCLAERGMLTGNIDEAVLQFSLEDMPPNNNDDGAAVPPPEDVMSEITFEGRQSPLLRAAATRRPTHSEGGGVERLAGSPSTESDGIQSHKSQSEERQRTPNQSRPPSRVSESATREADLLQKLVDRQRTNAAVSFGGTAGGPTVATVAPQTKPMTLSEIAQQHPRIRSGGETVACGGMHPFTIEAQQVMNRQRAVAEIKAAAKGADDPEMVMAVRKSCSASLRPLRQPKLVASGRNEEDWVPSNHQFIPLVVREKIGKPRDVSVE